MLANSNPDRFILHFTPPFEVSFNPETCEGNDGSIQIDLGTTTINGNDVVWDAEIIKDGNTIATQSSINNVLVLDQLDGGLYSFVFNRNGYELSYDFNIEDRTAVSAFVDNIPSNEVNLGTTITFSHSSTGANSYTWNVNNCQNIVVGPSLTQVFANPGDYIIQFKAENDHCSDEVIFTVKSVELTSGIANDPALQDVNIYAAKDVIYIDLRSIDAENLSDAFIYDMVGSLVAQSLNIGKEQINIKLGNANNGYYLVKIVNGTDSIVKKVAII